MDRYFKIQHFIHPDHPLILIDLKDSGTRGLIEAQKKINREKQRSESAESVDNVSIWCVLCGNEMLDTSYSCIDCDIHLHKLCAKLPTEMMHPSHPQHPLTLADPHIIFRCDICSKELGNGFSYYCRSCGGFEVDVKCAKLPPTEMMHPSHPQHPLTLTDDRSFVCDICNKSGEGFSYYCRSCDFDVDVKCAKLPTEMMHPSHPQHPLTLTDHRRFRCNICSKSGNGFSYYCRSCDFDVDLKCAKLPPTEMMHPSHPQHPLTLTDDRSFVCDICNKSGEGFSYYCRSCDFDVDVKCAKLPTEMMHPSHPQHPLTLTDHRRFRCNICSKSGNGFSYYCRSCDFDVDLKCAKSPTEMMHPSHPQHPLTLTDRHIRFWCDICSKELGNGFRYYCRSCGGFEVDVKCASKSEAINHKGHPHPLYPFLRTVLFRCDACGTEHSAAAGGVSYMCNTCDFWIHEDCATLPATVKYRHHVHPLSLVVHSPFDNPSWSRCQICREKFLERWSRWIYECGGCEHEVHTICLAKTLIAERNKTYEVDLDIDPTKVFHLPESFKYDDLVAQMIKHMNIHYGGENTELSKVEGPLISHFSHKHPLTLIHNDMPSINKEDVLCNACVLPVSTPQVAYYSCTECNNYALHEWCAKLPNEFLQHPAHPHPLILQGPDHENFGATDCPACGFYSNGFSYRCDTAACGRWFAMDIKCLLPPAILHKAHKHPLKLVENCLNEGCVACPDQSFLLAYGCVSCCFYLHNACALKPIGIKHRYDKHHPFTSTSVRADDDNDRADDDEYVCEFCEKDIDPKWWFHHCLDCDLSACSECIFPKHGGRSHLNPHLTYSSPVHHHPLSYVKLHTTNNTSLCALCQCPIGRYALQCAQCKVMFHMYRWDCQTPSWDCSWTNSMFPLVLQEGPSCH